MTPADLAKPGTEHSEQCALFFQFALWQDKWPELMWAFAIPNGGKYGTDKAAAQREGSRMKAEGVKAGISDIMIPVPRHGFGGLFIEMKTLIGKESDKQIEFGAFVTTQGFLYRCCHGWIEAAETVEWYMS